MGEIELTNIYLSGIHLDIPKDEKLLNDMTHSGEFCPNDGHEMEKVSGHNRFTCHWCGGILEYEDGEKRVWYKGA